MIKITSVNNFEEIYKYQKGQPCPYYFTTDYEEWEKSFMDDVDGEGRKLFKELYVQAAYDEEQHYYEKNEFVREGITRSYYKVGK